jgi:hypothetical protein
MNALARFEGFMQDLIDRRVVRMLGGSLQPVELAHALGRCIEAEQVEGLAGPVAPSRFEVLLNPEDYADLRVAGAGLEAKLASYAVELARERSINFVAPPEVLLTADITVERGAVQVRAAVTEAPEKVTMRAWRRSSKDQARKGLHLEVPRPDGTQARLPIDHVPFAIGRREGNDLVLPDSSVSREHAAIVEAGDGRYLLRDLNSRNGTLVNGQSIAEAGLADGDRLTIGGFEVTVRIDGR